jgi:hypothetical protein
MMKRTKRTFALLMAVALFFCYTPSMAFAENSAATIAAAKTQIAAFTDMPSNWSTAALSNAAENGLLKGYEEKGDIFIKPSGTLTRAEIATIINRAFGTTEKTTLNNVTDVASTSWYATEIEKAVHMQTMSLATTMRPNEKITRQEAFTMLARAFRIQTVDSNYTALNGFTDKNSIASWAKGSMCALAEKGVLSGSNGSVNPTANITRAEFAKIMDSMVKQYVNTAGMVSEAVPSGNVMVNTPGVTLSNLTINGDLIVGDGVGSGDVILDSVKVTGKTLVRGGGVHSVIIKGSSSLTEIIVAKVDGAIRVAVEGSTNADVIVIDDGKDNVIIEGKVGTLRVASKVPVVVQNASVATVNVTVEDAALTLAKSATVATVNIAQAAESTKVTVAGAVTNLSNAAPKSELSVTGSVKTVDVTSTAKGTNLALTKDAKIEKLVAAANMTTSGEGKVASITGIGTVTVNGTNASSTTTPSSGSKSGGKSGGSNSGGNNGGNNGGNTGGKLDVSNQVGAADAVRAVILAKVDTIQTLKAESTGTYTGPAVTETVTKAASFDGDGDGSEGSPWEVDTAEELALIQDHLDEHFVLTGDIDLEDKNWTPIGAYVPKDASNGDVSAIPEDAFTGSFDGGGHTISNLTINRGALGQRDMTGTGLFGGIAGAASVQNLKIEDATVFSSGSCTGTLVGMSMPSDESGIMIKDITISGTNKITGSFYVAGLIGSAADTNIQDCSVKADVILNSAGGSGAGILGGGLEGGSLSNCTVTGTVTATEAMNYNGTTMGVSGIGGLAGCAFESDKVINCKAENVTIKVGANAIMIGGLLGYAGIVNEGALADADNSEGFTLIKECVVKGLNLQAGAGANRIGGIVGSGFCGPNYNSYYPASSAMHIVDCTASGTIKADNDVILGSILGYAFRNCAVVSCDGSGITGVSN